MLPFTLYILRHCLLMTRNLLIKEAWVSKKPHGSFQPTSSALRPLTWWPLCYVGAEDLNSSPHALAVGNTTPTWSFIVWFWAECLLKTFLNYLAYGYSFSWHRLYIFSLTVPFTPWKPSQSHFLVLFLWFSICWILLVFSHLEKQPPTPVFGDRFRNTIIQPW